ncbi:MAG: DUF3515 domain-containing protein [Hamadaea sp.]|uniref:DUF3515 domain-containing protein n=1 Tax=Hamadaea sp. TaxID=2024425 RepID=UPI001818FBCC|nr:DUF3515 domain-containing protein [Hamadaea sp.]NUR73135.1 DUF3515 domain-containing protein [Hamadaea sp.]NUT20117.1 DUF3515 domain-containing protein [Hamadaea sp.]
MSPRLLAALIALPVALLTGVVVYNLGMPGDTSAQPNATATGPVTVDAQPLNERAAVVCRALVAKLPDRVRDMPRRPVTAGTEQNAAYGDPAMVVSCGVPPASFPETDDVWLLNGVCWHTTDASGSTVWQTVDREIPVKVNVPGAKAGSSQWVIGLTSAIGSTVPSASTAPSGCTTAAVPTASIAAVG